MKPSSTRRFTIADSLVMIAAFALGFVLIREYVETLALLDGLNQGRYSPVGALRWLPAVDLGCVASSFGLLACRFLKPRLRMRRVFRQPGTIPGLVSSLIVLQVGLETIAAIPRLRNTYYMGSSLIHSIGYFSNRLSGSIRFLGFTIAAIWIVLALGRWWRPERSWIDRAGRLLGIYWILASTYQRWSILWASL